MPRGATPSRWCVCQFHHFGCFKSAIHGRAQAIHGSAFLPAATFSEELRAEPACSSAVVAAAEQEAAGPVDPVAPAVERAAGPAVWPVAAPAGPAADSFVALLRG